MELETTSFRMFGTTKEKLEQARHKMSKTMGYNNMITWDTFFDTLMNIYLSKIENSFENKFDLMKEEQSNVDVLRSEMKECFKQQNNNIEELIGALVKQNNTAEILQELKSIKDKTDVIETQNTNIVFGINSVREFNILMNNNIKDFYASVNKLLQEVSEAYSGFIKKIETSIKRQFGIAVPIILHNMLRELCVLSKKVTKEKLTKEEENEAYKYAKEEIQTTISNYKNLYNSSYSYSDDDIDKLIDKYAMKEQQKN